MFSIASWLPFKFLKRPPARPSPMAQDESNPWDRLLTEVLGLDLPRHYCPPFHDLSRYETGQQKLLAAAHRLPAHRAGVEDWVTASRMLVERGCLRLAGAVRDKAVRLAIDQASSNDAAKERVILGFEAAVELGDLSLAGRMLDKLRASRGVGQLTLARLNGYLLLHQGDLEGFHHHNPVPETPPERRFLDYVQGRSIALVGPAPGGAMQGAEIDRFDAIGRCNHRGNDSRYDAQSAGSRTEISFYSKGFLQAATKEDPTAAVFFDWLEAFDWAVLKGPDLPFFGQAMDSGKAILRQWNQLLFNGHPNLIPSNLYSTLFFRPKRVKIFNSNFFLGRSTYSAGYRPAFNPQYDLAHTLEVMASHDPVAQICFIRNLHRARVVELDEGCAEVVSLSNPAYLAALEATFFGTPSIAPGDGRH